MTTQAAAVRQIIAGPSREELFDGLRLRHENREVTFTLAPPQGVATTTATTARLRVRNSTFKVQVDCLEVEDGSGNNWNFKLYDRNAVLGSHRLKGYINVTRREGWLEPI